MLSLNDNNHPTANSLLLNAIFVGLVLVLGGVYSCFSAG
jgi:hypothetical protein